MPELYMNNTISSNNTQYGLYIENVRNYVIVNESKILNNAYGAGIRVFGGAGEFVRDDVSLVSIEWLFVLQDRTFLSFGLYLLNYYSVIY